MSRHFARNTAFGVVAGLATSFGKIATAIIVARILGVHDTGVFNFGLWIAGVALALIDLGMYPALIRYLPEVARENGEDDAKNLAARLIRPLLASVALVMLAFATVATYAHVNPAWMRQAGLESSPALWVLLGLLCACQGLANFGIGYLQGMQRFHVYAALAVASTAMQIAVCAVGAALFGVLGALMGSIAAVTLYAGVGLSVAERKPTASRDLSRRVFRYSRYAWAGGLTAAFIWARPEVAFVQHYWGNEAVGLYSVGYTLAALAAQGPALLCSGLMPYFSENAGPQYRGEVIKMIHSGTRLLAFMMLPMCLTVAALAPQVVRLLFGQSFGGAAVSSTILVGSAALWGNMAILNAAVAGRERSDFTFSANLLGAILMMALSYVLIPSLGIVGAAAARALAAAFLLSFTAWFVVRRLEYSLPFRELGRLLIAALCCALVARLIASVMPTTLGTLFACGTSVACYLFLVRMLNALPTTDLDRLQTLFQRLPGGLPSLVMPILVRVLQR